MTFDWNSSFEFENGHHRSNVTPINRGFLHPPWKMFVHTITFERLNQSKLNFHFLLIFLLFFFSCYHDYSRKAQPIQNKFSHMTFDRNSLAKFKDWHHRSHITPLIRAFCHPVSVTTIILDWLNQSKPNFHTCFLTRIAQPSSKMGITGHMQSP